MKNLTAPAIGITVLSLTIIGILEFFHIKPGNFVDWGIAIGGFWWLMIITTVPWNMHFRAKETVEDARNSINKKINVKEDDLQYAEAISRRYLWIAVGLHLVTATGLYLLAYLNISEIGYFGAALAILLTLLRPTIRLHEYITTRLSNIKVEIRYPREDVIELRQQLNELQALTQQHAFELDSSESTSFTSKSNRNIDYIGTQLGELSNRLERYHVENQKAHEALAHKSENAIQQLSEDTQFLNQARDLIRFIKKA